jgi:DNA-binding transcriptional LysR family regulator
VARERNFTRAAEMLHIAQPPLSRQIQQLEDELGVMLIERGSRPVRLTDAGRLLYDQAVQVLERVEEIRAITQRLHELERPRFRIGFVPSTLYGRLPELIRRYRAVRQGVELTLRERGLKPPAVYEVRELQTALGLVAAEVGVCLVPVSVERLRRDNVMYRPLNEEKAASPIIMSTSKGDKSPEIAFTVKLIREIYRKAGISFGV